MNKYILFFLNFLFLINVIHSEKIQISDLKGKFFLTNKLSGYSIQEKGNIFSESGKIVGIYKKVIEKNGKILCKADLFGNSNNKTRYIEIKKKINYEKTKNITKPNNNKKDIKKAIPEFLIIDKIKFIKNGNIFISTPIELCNFKKKYPKDIAILGYTKYLDALKNKYKNKYKFKGLTYDTIRNNKEYFLKTLKKDRIICPKDLTLGYIKKKGIILFKDMDEYTLSNLCHYYKVIVTVLIK